MQNLNENLELNEVRNDLANMILASSNEEDLKFVKNLLAVMNETNDVRMKYYIQLNCLTASKISELRYQEISHAFMSRLVDSKN